MGFGGRIDVISLVQPFWLPPVSSGLIDLRHEICGSCVVVRGTRVLVMHDPVMYDGSIFREECRSLQSSSQGSLVYASMKVDSI